MESVAIPHTTTRDAGAIRRSVKRDLVGSTSLNGCTTLFETFEFASDQFAQRPCLGVRIQASLEDDSVKSSSKLSRFVFDSYIQVYNTAIQFGNGLHKLDCLRTSKNLNVLGIYMKNSKDWIIAENACYSRAAATVPLYDTLGEDVLEFIINQTQMVSLVCTESELSRVIAVSQLCPSLKHVIVSGTMISRSFPKTSFHCHRFDDVIRIGKAYPQEVSPPSPDDIATLCYTSGTTGKPKGAIITHRNMIAVCSSGLKSTINVAPGDYYLSFLPLAHIFERIVVNGLIASGCSIGFFCGDITKLGQDLIDFQPTVFCAVPRLLTRIHDKVLAVFSNTTGTKGWLLRKALASRLKELNENGRLSAGSIYDRLVFGPVKKSLGLQRVRILISGGAPLPSSSLDFFRVLLGDSCRCFEGYGQTETAGCTTITSGNRSQIVGLTVGNVGGPLPVCEVRLVDVPDMGYRHTDTMHSEIPCEGRGEVWVRGPGVIQGYFDDIDATKEAFSNDGWLKSGDIGMWTTNGQLVIIDRKKNLLKLSQGEYVAIEKIENVLNAAPLVAQVFVHGESTENKLVCVIVPDNEVVVTWIKQKKDMFSLGNEQALATNAIPWTVIHSELLKDIKYQLFEQSQLAGLKGFEQVYAVHIETKLVWTPENGFLTPTMKLKRNVARDNYQTEIKNMYDEIHANDNLRSKL